MNIDQHRMSFRTAALACDLLLPSAEKEGKKLVAAAGHLLRVV